MLPTPRKNRSGLVRQILPSDELFQQLACAYLYSDINNLCPLRRVTVLSDPDTRPTIKDFNMFALLDDADITQIFDTYTKVELTDIIAQVITEIQNIYNSDPSKLDPYLQIFYDRSDVKFPPATPTPPPTPVPATYKINPNLFANFNISSISIPSASVPPHIPSSPSTMLIPHRTPCPFDENTKASKRPPFQTYKHLILTTVDFKSDFLKWYKAAISFLDVSTNCIDPHELVETHFLRITEYEYGVETKNPSFKLSRGYDYYDLFLVLCFFHMPAPTPHSLLTDLEDIKMEPVDPYNFTSHTLASYNAYVKKYKTYILDNADFVNNLADPSILSDQFVRNLSFNKTMLDISKLKLKTFHAVLAQIAEFTAPHIILLEHYPRPSPVSRPSSTHISPPSQVKKDTSKDDKSGSQPPRIYTCWNCEGRPSSANNVAHDYKKCAIECRFCGTFCRTNPDPSKAYCEAFRTFRNDKYAALRAARGTSPGSDRPTKVTTPGSTPSPILYHTCIPSDPTIRNSLPIIDSGATYSCVNNISHMSPLSIYTPIIPNSLGVVTLGDNLTHLPIQGIGQLVGDTTIDVKYVPTLGESVISVADIVDSNNIVFFDKSNMYSITLNDIVETKYNEFLNFAKASKFVSLTSTRACDRLYRMDISPQITHLATPIPPTSTSPIDSTYVSPSSPPSPRTVIHITTSSPPGSTLEELVLFYHTLWNHCTKPMMLSNLSNKVYTPIPRQLTADAIHKYFPKHCVPCSIGSMKVKPHPQRSIPRHIDPGAELQVDIQVWYSTGNRQTIVYNGAKYNLTCVDLATDFTWCYSLRDMKYLCRYLELYGYLFFANTVSCLLYVVTINYILMTFVIGLCKRRLVSNSFHVYLMSIIRSVELSVSTRRSIMLSSKRSLYLT